jgi:hypothetical protein
MNATVVTASGRKQRPMTLPLLLVLFLTSYGLLTALVVRQSNTINSQRSLIHLLFKDNLHLASKKTPTDAGAYGKMQAQAQTPSAQVPLNQVPSTQIPSSQIPLIQVPPLQVPSGKENLRAGTKPGRKSRKAEKALPTRPPAELTDPSDMRRVSFAI